MTYLKTAPVNKARLTFDYLNANGGALPEQVREDFIVLAIQSSDFLSAATSVMMTSTTYRIPTWEMGSRALHRRTRGQALPDALRTRPTTVGPTITAYDYAAECTFEAENLESGVSQEAMRDTIMRTLEERVAQDAADIVINSNTGSATDDYVNFNGFYTGVTSNTAAAGTTRLSPVNCDSLWRTLDPQFQRPGLTIRTSPNAQKDYWNAIGDRPTALGDEAVEKLRTPIWQNSRVVGDQFFPQNLGGGLNETIAVMSNEKDFFVGIHRDFTTKSDEDIRAGTYIVVITLRMGANWSAEKMAGKLTGILAS